MVAWKPRPFVFVHIPKCAGTSIEKAFIPLVCKGTDFKDLTKADRSRHWLPGIQMRQHAKLSQLSRHFKLSEFYKFAFVRNPWDRTVSQIEYLRDRGFFSHLRGREFKHYVRMYCNIDQMVMGHDLRACQLDYLLDANGKLGVDYIGRFETLKEDFGEICRALGMQAPPPLPHIFKSGRVTHYSEFFDEESAEWVGRRFQRDAEFFKYQFEDRRGAFR